MHYGFGGCRFRWISLALSRSASAPARSPKDFFASARLLYAASVRGRDIVKCCGWRRAHPEGLSGGFDVTILKFDALDDEFNEFVAV